MKLQVAQRFCKYLMDKKVIQYSVTKLHKLNLNSTRDISVTSDTSDTCFPLFFIFNIFFDKHIFSSKIFAAIGFLVSKVSNLSKDGKRKSLVYHKMD